MRKYLILMFATLLFVGFSFPMNSKAAIADGTYSVQYQVNKPGSNSASMANDYFLKPAKLIVNNGKMTMQLTIKKSGWVTQFNPPGGAKVISANEAADQRMVQFSISNAHLTTIAMKIDIEDIDYHHAYSVDFVFNTDALPEAKAEEPKQQTTPAPAQTKPATTPSTSGKTPTQSSGSNTSSNKPATPTEKVTTESSNAQSTPVTTNDDSTKSEEIEQSTSTSTDIEQAEESEAVENPETSDELPIMALLLLIVATIVFIRTKKTKTYE
ncbi:MAG: NEAT domain-containing protein [Kurthia sp.]|nr:NEAT domain-containing protein [Candidatus Kurthia equi]